MKQHLIYPILSLLSMAPATVANQVEGEFLGTRMKVELDHPLAEQYFLSATRGELFAERVDSTLERELTEVGGHPLTEKSMAFLTEKVSVDFATLYLCRRLHSVPANAKATKMYLDLLGKNSNYSSITAKAKDHLYVFVPGLFYRRHPEAGGDLAAQIDLLNSLNLHTYLIPTNEIGTVEENAQIITKELRKLKDRNIILISASKGGPDLAYALGSIMNEDECAHIKAWVSIGGVLRGSEIADKHTNGIRRLFTRLMTGFMGGSVEFVDDLTRKKSIPRYAKQNLPRHIVILHYVGAPLESQVGKDVKDNFQQLSVLGPNDGLTTLLDELTPNGTVITELGLDHYFRHPRIEEKSLALLQTVLELVE